MDQRRVVEVHNPSCKSGGSGYLIRNNLILTAHHVIAPLDQDEILRPSYHIRFIGDYLQGRTEWIQEGCDLCWDDPIHDLALLRLKVDKPKPKFLSSQEPAIRFGKLGLGCNSLSAEGIGFPFVQEIENRQNPEELAGYLSWISGLKEKQLRLQVTSPIPNSSYQWQGISGTALFVKDLLVGVIVETNKSFAEKCLWATPISLVASNEEFCKLVLDDPNGKIILQDVEEPVKLNPFQAPPLPNYYVDRPEYSQDLKKRLLRESSDVRTLVVTAIHGLGSVGKSTLATALAHDQEVQAHFGDGILWATLGQQPNLLSLLSGWIQALGDYNFKATSVEAASNQLRTLLYDKAVLLVVDDAWNIEDAQVFNVGGARCQVLVTTREAAIADVLGASTYSLDVMTPEQAMELLTKKLKRLITGEERQSASDLAKAVGYLPLALELVAAEVASGTTWTQLLEDFQQEVARLKTLDRPEAGEITDEAILKRFSLRASLNLSVKRMPTKKQQHFSWLGVLPEDVTITKMMAATLWKMDLHDTAKTLQYLQNKALLLSGVPLPDGTPTYRLHDLFHDLARNLLTAPPNPEDEGDLPGLGITLPAAHATFLEKYRNKTSKNLWHTLPNDGYIHQHLVWHLEKAQKVEEIHELLREDSETGSNGWYEACDRLGQTANFVTDVARAWKLAEDSWTEATLPQVIGLQCRYALMIASLNSLAANLPVELLIALVQKNVWTPEQGLAYVLQSSNPDDKANLLTQLANHLPPNLKELALSKALAAARQIQDESSRADALSSLAPILPPDLLSEALAAAREIHDERYRANTLRSLAPILPPDLLSEALAAVREIQDECGRADALNSLAVKLPELLPEALAAARQIQYEWGRACVLSRLAPILPPDLLSEALAAVREIHDKSSRAKALSSLAVQLPELLPEALAAARAIHDKSSRANALSSLAPILRPDLLSEALAAARQIQDERYRAKVLSSLAVQLPELLPEALAAVREIQDEWGRAKALSSLAVQLPELLPESLAAARQIQDESSRAKALSSLAPVLPPDLFSEALAAVREIHDKSSRAKALSSLAVQLPELLPESLAAARAIHDERYRADALSSLAVKLPELLSEALAAVREIHDERYRADTLRSLAPILPPDLLSEALAAVREIHNESCRADTLRSLAPILPPDLLSEALAAAREIHNESCRAKAISSLAIELPELLPEALAATRQIQDEYHRATVLSILAIELPELLPEVLAATRQIQDEYHRAIVLSILAIKLPELLPEALAATRQIQDEYHRADALSILAIELPELLPEVLAAARQIQDEYHRATVLSSLVVKLPELLSEALAAVRQIQDEYHRVTVLSSLAVKLPELLPEALAAARQIHDKSIRATALSSLAPILCLDLLSEALAAARQIQSDSSRAKALSSLAVKLSQIQKRPLFDHWRDTLHILSVHIRPNLLSDIKALTPVIPALGGQEAVKYTASAIQDVSRWWS